MKYGGINRKTTRLQRAYLTPLLRTDQTQTLYNNILDIYQFSALHSVLLDSAMWKVYISRDLVDRFFSLLCTT